MSTPDAFYVLSALTAVGTRAEVLAGPLRTLSHAQGARERLLRLGRPPSVCVVFAYRDGTGPR